MVNTFQWVNTFFFKFLNMFSKWFRMTVQKFSRSYNTQQKNYYENLASQSIYLVKISGYLFKILTILKTFNDISRKVSFLCVKYYIITGINGGTICIQTASECSSHNLRIFLPNYIYFFCSFSNITTFFIM